MEEENFFIDKIKNQAKKENVNFTELEERVLLSYVPTQEFDFGCLPDNIKNFYKDSKNPKILNNKAVLLLRHAMKDELKSASEIKRIRLGWLKWFKMPVDWYNTYITVYNTSDKVISGILQNFVMGNPFE